MKVTNDTVTISGLDDGGCSTLELKDADPNELQLFIEKMPASIKGESVKYFFKTLFDFGFGMKRYMVEPLSYLWKQADQG